jgi:uncharacterized protein YndB with AHSA1/START domain
MARQKSFKRLVRARMDRTGESYTAARAALLAADGAGTGAPAPAPLATSDAAIRRRTGRGWEEWFDLLDDWGAAGRGHREIALRVAGILEIDPLAWNAQAVATSYERARGLRQAGRRADGFAVSAPRTVAVSAEELFDAFVDEDRRARWLPGAPLRPRASTPPRSARFDWDDGPSRVDVTVADRGDGRAVATVAHERLPDAAEAERMKAFWRGRVAALKEVMEA